jgi:hypothetical protein
LSRVKLKSGDRNREREGESVCVMFDGETVVVLKPDSVAGYTVVVLAWERE